MTEPGERLRLPSFSKVPFVRWLPTQRQHWAHDNAEDPVKVPVMASDGFCLYIPTRHPRDCQGRAATGRGTPREQAVAKPSVTLGGQRLPVLWARERPYLIQLVTILRHRKLDVVIQGQNHVVV